MGDDRFREVFRRLVARAPEPPAFKDLETHQASRRPAARFQPWMAAVAAGALVLLIGIVGAMGGGGPDLAAPDGTTVAYSRIEYSVSIEAVCEGGEVRDNGGFDDVTIEFWGPNRDELTAIVATFPDGSTEKTVVEGNLYDPDRTWGRDPAGYPGNTAFRVVECDVDGTTTSLVGEIQPAAQGPLIPLDIQGPPPGAETWGDALGLEGEPVRTEWEGVGALLYQMSDVTDDWSHSLDLYVDEDGEEVIHIHVERSIAGVGTSAFSFTVAERKDVPSGDADFATDGLVEMDHATGGGFLPDDCPVTIPSLPFTPPEGYPPTPVDPDLVWFGKDELWTALSKDGSYDPRKSVWWSVNFPGGSEEENPPLVVSYRLLNSPRGLTFETTAATNAYTAEDGWFIIAGIDSQYSGCWEVTAVYKDASLTYVYYNPEGADPEPIVPNVVGMTVERAGNVLHDAGYESAPFDSDDPTYEVCAQEPGAGAEASPGAVVGLRTAPTGGCGELMAPTGLYNRAYQDEEGRRWYGTDCPAADILVTGGIESADGLPRAGETTRARVDGRFQVSGGELITPGTLGIEVVPRLGEVWDYDEDGGVVVFESGDDYLIKVLVDSSFPCPDAPHFWNGIPVAYVRGEG